MFVSKENISMYLDTSLVQIQKKTKETYYLFRFLNWEKKTKFSWKYTFILSEGIYNRWMII